MTVDHASQSSQPIRHPQFTRRTMLQAGAIGLLGLGTNHLTELAATASNAERATDNRKSVIFIFLSGGLSQLESFDLKPHAPDNIRGEFQPIATRTPGIHISEHLPRLAAQSQHWCVVRSLTHPYNEHSQGHHVMMTGRTPMPTGFDASRPKSSDFPSIAALAGNVAARRGNLPPAVVLPEKLVHRTGRTIPGQFAGQMGNRNDPWFVEAAPDIRTRYGAFPEYGFHHERGAENPSPYNYAAPSFTLPEGILRPRFNRRLRLLDEVERQSLRLDQAGQLQQFDRHRQDAVSMLQTQGVRRALNVHAADVRVQERYGRNSFGWSLLMARQLVEAGVRLVQVNLGNNESWDTHQAAFRNLRDFLFPPTDRAVSALLADLNERGLLESTMVVMCSEFGRTPRVFNIPRAPLPGRDHWGAVQSVFFAGGGVRGGTVIGSTDSRGGSPSEDPVRPENMAASIYETLGLPQTVAWHDQLDRPHFIYHSTPITGLTS